MVCLGHLGLLQRGRSSITDPNNAISVAKGVLLQLSSFSNVSDSSVLQVQEATNYNPTPLNISDWTVTFKNQILNGIEVWNTDILVLINDNTVLLDWHHYKYAFIPDHDLISKERAKKLLVGKDIIYDCWTPGKFTVTDASIKTESMSLCVFPLVKGDSLELRIAWKIPIFSFSNIYPAWYYFIDVLSGETVRVEQLSIC